MIVFFSIFNSTTNCAMDIYCRNDGDCLNDIVQKVCIEPGDVVACLNPNSHLSMCACLRRNSNISGL
ncbi:hypothetical protein P8452_50610 [Trifolium repens]|nr:hypothetical protein P8452_50610 [Trifolium repens]